MVDRGRSGAFPAINHQLSTLNFPAPSPVAAARVAWYGSAMEVRRVFLIGVVFTLFFLAVAQRAAAQCTGCAQYGAPQRWASNVTSALTDASGLAASAKNPAVLWAHNDSGGEPLMYAISTNGTFLAAFDLKADTLADFEDMAIGPG